MPRLSAPRVVTVDPDPLSVPPPPVTGHPNQTTAMFNIVRPVQIIRAIADRDSHFSYDRPGRRWRRRTSIVRSASIGAKKGPEREN